MFDKIFGYPVLKLEIPNHKDIKGQFKPFIEKEESFDNASDWDCNCKTTYMLDAKNQNLPWDTFFKNLKPVFNQYLQAIGVTKQHSSAFNAYAWANRYDKGNHQEIHAHYSNGCLISCAYMLDLPSRDAGEFIFYNSAYVPFERQLMNVFHDNARSTYNKRYNPLVNEGEIIFFPSSLEHYVTWNRTDNIRSSISANFTVNVESLTS